MSEELVERLTRFTPDAGRLDRDALLFAAGKASARPNHSWVALAALLANAQIVSLVLLWHRPEAPERGVNVTTSNASIRAPSLTRESRAPSDGEEAGHR
jgi:hypothetical protein